MARINVETAFFGDARLAYLNKLSKEDIHTTIGRIIMIWRQCYEQKSAVMEISDVAIHSGWESDEYADMMIKARLAEMVDGKFRVKGIQDRIDYLLMQSERGKKGGIARSRSSNRDEKGRLLPKQTPSKRQANAYHSPDEAEAVSRPTSSSTLELYTPLATKWVAWGREQMPSLKADVRKCADEFRKLHEIDKLNIDQMQSMLKFVQGDDFWSANAISPASLRTKSKNGMRKFENILNAMNKRKRKTEPQPIDFSEKDGPI